MSKKRKWPPGLKGHFPWKRLHEETKEKFSDVEDPDEHQQAEWDSYVKKLREGEVKRRVTLLTEFFGLPWPQSEVDSLRLMFMVCQYFKVPGFQQPPGRHEKWGSLKNKTLFADVMSVVTKMSRPSEIEAVRRVARNPEKFLNRYKNANVGLGEKLSLERHEKTLHRQFLRAKLEFEKLDRTYPSLAPLGT
jgi:hypothetical protein